MTQETPFTMIVKTIIAHQQIIIGPLAIEQANKVPGVKADLDGEVYIDAKTTNMKDTLLQLVMRYEELFGQTSIEVCKDAVRDAHMQISDKDLPDILK